MESFGKREHRLEYKKRIGAYGIIQNAQQKFLTVAATDGYLFLVGGGLEEKDEPIAALQREILEETGFSAHVSKFLGQAEKHWVSPQYPEWPQHNIGYFYACQLLEKIAEPVEKEPIFWASMAELEQKLFHEHHLYMVKQFENGWQGAN
ncbi:NUDIX domain-containing protein [Enterococcus sp. LJL120]